MACKYCGKRHAVPPIKCKRAFIAEYVTGDLPPRDPALDIPDEKQERIGRWLLRWGPRLVAWINERRRR